MNWKTILLATAKAMPSLLPTLLRQLAEEIEKNPATLAALLGIVDQNEK